MKLSELFALPYPEEDDLGALALYMQNLAYNLEDLLSNVNDPLGEFPSRPLVYATNLVDSISIAGSGTDNQSATPDFDLTTPMLSIGDFDYASYGDDSSIPCPANRTGLWALGASATNLTATTPNVETWRYLEVTAFGQGPGVIQMYTGPRFTHEIQTFSGGSSGVVTEKAQESNTGSPGAPLTVDCLAWVPPGSRRFASPDALFTMTVEVSATGNTSSAIPVPVSSVYAWAVWLGTGEETITQVGG
jgi:hypothetical protein